MSKKRLKQLIASAHRGQGLVEYALILVLVAVVVIIVLAILGPTIGNLFSNVVTLLRNPAAGGGVITSVTAERHPDSFSNNVRVTITVSTNTTITATDSQSGQSDVQPCNGSCSVILNNVGAAGGTVTVTAEGASVSASYGPQS
jgi:pilus assembly protein Flp/PilA